MRSSRLRMDDRCGLHFEMTGDGAGEGPDIPEYLAVEVLPSPDSGLMLSALN